MIGAFVPAELTEALRGMWHGRWAGLAVAWLAGLAGATFIFLTPDKYEATARVYVDTQSILKPLMTGLTVQPNVEQEVANLSRTLISRPNLQKLVRMTDMDLHLTTAEQREKLIEKLTRTLYIKSVGEGNLYTIGFSDPEPAQATRVVQSLLSIFVESGLSAKSNDTGQARRFIEEQIQGYEQRLTEAENRLKDFKLHNIDLTSPAGADFFESFSTLTESLREARLQLQEAHRSRDALKQQIADEQDHSLLSLDGVTPVVAATPELDARLNTLAKSLDEMLISYTENHPDVLNTRRSIRELEAQRDAERKRLSEEMEKRQRKSPAQAVYPQLKLALAEAEAQVAGLQVRVADFARRHAELREKARLVPEREAQLAQLNRDYAIQKQNYETLVSRRESVLISGQMEAATGIADFRIIDPPRVSPTPVSPNRKMLIPLALLASLCAGIAASYFFSLLHPTFHDHRGLRKIGLRPVLGAVTLIPTLSVLQRRRRGALLFFGGAGGLAAVYGAAIAVVFYRSMSLF